MGNWLVPFKGRNHSGAYDINFLWQENITYVMDNHRAALWCWMQHLNNDFDTNYFHIDRHTDTLQSNLSSWVSQSPNLHTVDLSTYLSLGDSMLPGTKAKLFRWDNYASIFLDRYGSKVGECYFATYGEGDNPNHKNVTKVSPWLIVDNLDFWVKGSDRKWILNLDLDYFCHALDDDHKIMYSDQYIHDLFSKIKLLRDDGHIEVLTICFSPECCGGWSNSEKLWAIAESCLNTGLKLPP